MATPLSPASRRAARSKPEQRFPRLPQERPLDAGLEREELVEHRRAVAGIVGGVAEVLVERDVADVAVGVADRQERPFRPAELEADLGEELAGKGGDLELA